MNNAYLYKREGIKFYDIKGNNFSSRFLNDIGYNQMNCLYYQIRGQ